MRSLALPLQELARRSWIADLRKLGALDSVALILGLTTNDLRTMPVRDLRRALGRQR